MTPQREDGNVSVPFNKWMEMVGTQIAEAAAERVLEKHKAECPIMALEETVYGDPNDTRRSPGLVRRVEGLERCKQAAKSIIREWLKPVVVAVVTAAAMLLINHYVGK